MTCYLFDSLDWEGVLVSDSRSDLMDLGDLEMRWIDCSVSQELIHEMSFMFELIGPRGLYA